MAAKDAPRASDDGVFVSSAIEAGVFSCLPIAAAEDELRFGHLHSPDPVYVARAVDIDDDGIAMVEGRRLVTANPLPRVTSTRAWFDVEAEAAVRAAPSASRPGRHTQGRERCASATCIPPPPRSRNRTF